MTVRFKGQSEYQKSYGVSSSTSASHQNRNMLAGLNSDPTGINREPGLQRKKRSIPLGSVWSRGSVLCSPYVQQSLAEPRTLPSGASGSRFAHKEISASQKPPKLLGAPNSRSPHESESSTGYQPVADRGPLERPDPGSSVGSVTERKSVKSHPSQPSQSQPSKHVSGLAPDEQQPSVNMVDHVLKRRTGMRSEGHRSRGQRSEYNRHFDWKKPVSAASPLLTAEQVLYSSNRSVPPFKAKPVSVETEYQQNFQSLILPTVPRLRKHLENQQTTSKKEETQRKPRPKQDTPQRENNTPQSSLKATPSPLQVQRGRRLLTEYESSFRSPLYRNSEGSGAIGDVPLQAKELREQAQLYRHRAWGTNFSRDHLGQLLSDNNILWEPTMDSLTDPPTPYLTTEPSSELDSHSTSCLEALDLASNSSKRSSVADSGETYTHKKTQRDTKAKTPRGLVTERRTAWEEDEAAAEHENADEEEGRLPTPRLKTNPVQRTHHDLTTPATGGAILVGKLKSADGSTPNKQQRCGSAVSMDNGAESNMQAKRKEAWSENIASSTSLHPKQKPASSPSPNRMKKTPPSPAALPPLIPVPQHGIQGTLRHPDFQHNGDLGLRFRERPCPGGGCGSDEDDRLSVMSWRSAASCSAASAVLERARRRRENYWGKT